VKQLYEAVGRIKERAIDTFCLIRGGKTGYLQCTSER